MGLHVRLHISVVSKNDEKFLSVSDTARLSGTGVLVEQLE